MHGWRLWLMIALVVEQTHLVGWREVFSVSRCSVAICKCRDCAGGVNCCCAKAKTPLERAIAISQCDRAEQQQLMFSRTPPMASAPPLLIPAPILAFVPYLPLYLSSLYRFIPPRDPPPRNSFKLPLV